MQKGRMGKQLSLIDNKGRGQKAIHDKSIRHIERPKIYKASSLHVTVKILKEKSGLKNKTVLQILKRSILKARLSGLRIIHFTLEYDHVHMLVEASNEKILGRGMMIFGVTIAKGINKYRKVSGAVYKHRYHQRKIGSAYDLKNVMNYIFKNGVKHKTAQSEISEYNSLRAEIAHYNLFTKHKIKFDEALLELLDRGIVYFRGLKFQNQ